MKKQTPSEKLNEVTTQLKFLEEQNKINPNRKLSQVVRDLRIKKAVLEDMLQ